LGLFDLPPRMSRLFLTLTSLCPALGEGDSPLVFSYVKLAPGTYKII